ncbi:MAG TPA: GNAT family N-acetyltransferase [Opitutaceae bacterium]|nr:GNAT family N-acetyltransferase [Opitutaceae bacterium]
MDITYRTDRDLDRAALESLFLSVGWASGRHPERLQRAIRNSHHVVTAWCGERLVGLMNALSDGEMTAYFHYLLVEPEHQSRGIGRELVARMTAHYRDCTRLVLVAYKEEVPFYERCGFRVAERALPVQITTLDD